MAYLRKHPRSKYWSAWFTDETGNRTSRSTKVADKKQAAKIADKWEEDAAKARSGNLTASHVLKVYNEMLSISGQRVTAETVQDFAARWLKGKAATRAPRTAEAYQPTIKGFLESLGARNIAPVNAITTRDVEAYRDAMIASGKRKPTTINQGIKVLGIMFAAALKQGLVDSNPVSAVEIGDAVAAERKPFTDEDVGKIIAAASGEWLTSILLAVYTGMRLGDSVKLKWDAIDLSGKLITFTPEKTSRKNRVIQMPIHERLQARLMEIAGDSIGHVTPTLAATKVGSRNGLSDRFKSLMAQAGVDNEEIDTGIGRKQSVKSFHSFRHSFNTALLEHGVDEKTRMDLSGHTTQSMSRKYSHSKLETMREAVGKIKSGT